MSCDNMASFYWSPTAYTCTHRGVFCDYIGLNDEGKFLKITENANKGTDKE